jgi:hypothetical protein
MKKTLLQTLGIADAHGHILLNQAIVKRLARREVAAYDPKNPLDVVKTAGLGFCVNPPDRITLSNSETRLLAEDYITESLVAAKLLTDLIDIDPDALMIKVVVSSGDIRVTYMPASIPAKDGMGEPILFGGWIEVNPTIAASIQIVQNSEAAAKLHITQYGQ